MRCVRVDMKFKTIRRIHTYGGISAAIFLIVIGITGVILTFRSSLRPPPVNVPPSMHDQSPIDKLDIIKRAGLKMKLPAASVSFANASSRPHRITFKNEKKTSLYYSISGEFIERRDRPQWTWIRFMFDLHTGSIAGRSGELMIAMIGVVLVVSALSGIMIWPFLMKVRRRRQRSSSSSLLNATKSLNDDIK